MPLSWDDAVVEVADTQAEEHFQVHDSAWSKNLTVEVDGHGVVSHTGSAVLRLIADNPA